MLKLEKSLKLSDITIRFREKDPFFEARLLKALGLALFLHFIALLVFHATPFRVLSTFNFSPIEVISDEPIKINSLALTLLENDEFTPPPLHVTTSLDWLNFSPEWTLFSFELPNIDAFYHLEKDLWPQWDSSINLQMEFSEPLMELVVSGNLADYVCVNSHPLLHQPLLASGSSIKVCNSYNVQMDPTIGEIFWYEREELSGIKSIDLLTERVLLSLKFADTESSEFAFVSGKLNFVILTSKIADD